MPLWKISVSTSAAAEDAVAQLLERLFGQPASLYADARKQSVVATVYVPKASECSAARSIALRTGLRGIREAGLDIGPGRITVKQIRKEDWAESWKRHFKPIEIGTALLLKPSWSKRQPKKNQALVVLDPGLSFGTGQHPTTRFCLGQLVTVQKQAGVKSFLDIGTGSGILAIAAAKLGYKPISAFDSDKEAVRVARANAVQNGVAGKVPLLCRDLIGLPRRGGKRYDLVCANLIFDLLLQEADRICGRLRPGGRLVLAGILRSQFGAVRAAYEQRGVELVSSKAEREWASGAFVWRGE